MELLRTFGFDPIALGAQIVNFLLILYILRRFLYKPVLDLLEKRKQMIQEGVEKTEEARFRLEKIADEEKRILKNAQSQAVKTLENAKAESQNMISKAEESSKKLTEKMIQDATLQIQVQTDQAEKQLTKKVSELAVQFLEKALKDVFEEKHQEEIMEKTLKKMKKEIN